MGHTVLSQEGEYFTRVSVLSQEGGVTVLSQEGEYFTYVQACLYGGRPEILVPVRFNFLRSLRVVSISSDLVGHDAVSRGGVRDLRRYLSVD